MKTNWKALWNGFLSIFKAMSTFNLFPPQKNVEEELKELEKELRDGFKIDRKALKKDWQNIGNDMKKAMEKVKEEKNL